MSGWLLLHAYVLVHFLDFVDLLLQSDVFEYNTYCFTVIGGFVACICKTHLCTPRKLFRGC